MSADFFDTNVLIYLFDRADTRKHLKARELVQLGLDQHTASISFQVVQETLNVLTSKMRDRVTPRDARRFLDAVLVPLWESMPSVRLYERALEVAQRYQFQFYDALIVAAALESGSTRLYSEDLQDGQVIESLTIENPFRP